MKTQKIDIYNINTTTYNTHEIDDTYLGSKPECHLDSVSEGCVRLAIDIPHWGRHTDNNRGVKSDHRLSLVDCTYTHTYVHYRKGVITPQKDKESSSRFKGATVSLPLC